MQGQKSVDRANRLLGTTPTTQLWTMFANGWSVSGPTPVPRRDSANPYPGPTTRAARHRQTSIPKLVDGTNTIMDPVHNL